MIDIPVNAGCGKPEDFERRVDEACETLMAEINRQRGCGFRTLNASVHTEHFFKGGYPMCVITEAGRRFTERGWFAYLVQGPRSMRWISLTVSSREIPEGYSVTRLPSDYRRVYAEG